MFGLATRRCVRFGRIWPRLLAGFGRARASGVAFEIGNEEKPGMAAITPGAVVGINDGVGIDDDVIWRGMKNRPLFNGGGEALM
jgi:hypothetical protein